MREKRIGTQTEREIQPVFAAFRMVMRLRRSLQRRGEGICLPCSFIWASGSSVLCAVGHVPRCAEIRLACFSKPQNKNL
jgi:hypothetical protein